MLKCGSVTDTISVYQVSKDAIIIARNEYKFSTAGGELNFKIQSNVDFEVTTSGPWIQRIQPSTRGLVEYDLSFNILPNEINVNRTGVITIRDKANVREQSIYIKQIVVNKVDREALIALYNATNGDNWTNKTNWCSDKPLNEWHGVYTDNNDRVHIIDLSSNNLSGVLPAEIGNLQELTSFNVNSNNIGGSIPESFADLPLLEKLQLSANHLSGLIPPKLWKCKRWKSWSPVSNIFYQQPGYKLALEDCYISTNFSEDKTVITLQNHTKGNGIKVVLMGDLFVDTDVNSGMYENVMKETMENYFSIEPYKSLREYFDVIAIKAVSKHDWISGETAFETTLVWGFGIMANSDKCMTYAQRALGINSIDNVSVVLVVNLNEPISGGYCAMSLNEFSIACSTYNIDDPNDFKESIHCTAGGYGFGGLKPEFILYEEVFNDAYNLQQKYDAYGWYANVDCTSDPTKVKWAHFIKDPRYANEGLGVFEGALYKYGIYRATENSILGGHIDWFNAPSREAIYKRAMKLAYSSSWVYDYEKFVEFDTPARTATRSTTQQYRTSKNIKHVPLTIYNYPAVVK